MILLLLSGNSLGEGLSATSRTEIEHLLAYLGTSGCQFNRNGDWYDAKAATGHINDKYQYLLGKNKIASTDDFIEGAATRSSMSGKAYLVKCGNAEVVESGTWFRSELDKFRKSHVKLSKNQ